jgi:acylpyruvate hydrolase
MRLGLIRASNARMLVAQIDDRCVRLPDLPPDPLAVLTNADLRSRAEAAIKSARDTFDLATTMLEPPLAKLGKLICVGLNYADHAAESPYAKPDFPVYFLRVDTSIIGHNAPILRPLVSTQLDYEGELVAVIGKGGRNISMADALEHVVGYSLFNDGSIRDYQFKGPQWTLGKNFDATGPFGPFLVSADEVPNGGVGLGLKTILNGKVLQDANTRDLLFPLPELIARVSEAMTLEPGDVIVTGTPSGVGFARKPPIFMKDGDVCDIWVEGIGTLSNPIRDEKAA